MSSVLGLLLLAAVVTIIAYQITMYNKMVNDRFRFEYFALRDRLHLLVLTGKTNEKSEEYQQFLKVINFHINAVERLSIMRMAEVLVQFHTAPEKRRVKITHHKFESDEIKKLMVNFLDITERLLKRNNRAEIAVVRLFSKRHKGAPKSAVGREVSRPAVALNEIQRTKEKLSHSLDSEMVCV